MKTITRFLPPRRNHRLVTFIDTSKGYFSITADLYHGKKKEPIACGCLHDNILSILPALKPLVAIHLSDLDGIPMHAVDNGWYWLARAAGIPQTYEPDQSKDECFKLFCEHCRICQDDGKRILFNIKIFGKQNQKGYWEDVCESMKPRWKAEAEAALALINLISE